MGPAARHARRIMTVSEFSKKRTVELLNIPAEKIVVVGCGAEQAYFDIYEQDPATLARPCPEPYLLVIGGLNLRKGGVHVLAVAEELRRRGSELRILIAGPNDHLKERVKDYPNVRLLGFVPDEELPTLLRGATGLLFLSYYEGFGIPAAEAMAAGVPAIVSDRSSLPEVVGNAGFVFGLSDFRAIAALADNLLRDRGFRENYVLLGRQRAMQFRWPACVDRLLKGLGCAVPDSTI
jgi:glycosyltransferase involved in cell wall biosynthesis